MARKQKELIKAATIATVLDKLTGAILGFVVKSNRTDDYYHIQTEIIGGERVFFCDCDAHLWGYDECCHIKAVKEVLVTKAELARAEEKEAAEAIIAEAEAVLAEVRNSAPKYAPPRVGGFNRLGASVYISDAEMAAMKNLAAVRKAMKSRELAPLNGNAGFQLMR